ncbi:MAG: FecR domain-containing protein, partial [Chloroflexi bacterium]|nr:FecR domain-containing protein [Chloroflexota bacterium]
MKQVGFFANLMAYGVALLAVFAMASAQAAAGKAVVRTVRGTAQYTEGTKSGPLKVGLTLKSGAVVTTAANSQVDLFLGENGPVVRINQASTLALDKLTFEQTGIDTVIETEMNLKSGEILGNVKKLAKASTYEVKTPMGVAGIRGTQYNINADSGAVTVISGTVMFSYVNAAGVATVITVEAGSTFTPPTDRNVIPTAANVAPTPPAVEATAIDAVIASTTVSNPGQLQAAIKEIASTKAAQAAAAAPPGQGNAAAIAAAQAVVSAATATAQQAAQAYTGSGAAAVRNSASQAGAQSADIQVSSAASGASLSAAASAAVQAQQQGQSQAQIQQAAQNAAQAAAGQTAAAAGGTAGQIA